jgi:hypothetical protein
MTEPIIEVDVRDDADSVGATVRVLADGRIQVETDEGQWTLDLGDSHAVASTALATMAGES